MGLLLYFLSIIFILVFHFPLFGVGWLCGKTFDKKWTVTRAVTVFYCRVLGQLNPFWKVKIEGLENIDKEKTYMIMANHSSFYDIPLVNILPINMRWVAKKELLWMPILGVVLYLKNDILVKRGDAESAKHMMMESLASLRKGISMTVFPEGTRTKTGAMGEFKEGAFLVAKKARVAVLPVVLAGPYETTNKRCGGQFSRSEFTVRVMPEIPVAELRRMGIKELCDATYDIINAEHRKLAPQYYSNIQEEKKEN